MRMAQVIKDEYYQYTVLCKSMDRFLYDRDIRHERVTESPRIYYARRTNGKTINCIRNNFPSTIDQRFRENFDIISFACKFHYSITIINFFLPLAFCPYLCRILDRGRKKEGVKTASNGLFFP